jgi:conjugal transfer pilus assembly protein TraV
MKLKILALAALPVLIQGCASTLNTAGSSEFSCPGMPGVTCRTPVDVYKMTNGSMNDLGLKDMDSIVSLRPSGPDVRESLWDGGVTGARLPAKDARTIGASALPHEVVLPPQKNNVSYPRPVREAPKVLRVWIAPWVDSNDDLHWPSYLFTEVQPRTWSFGKTAFEAAGVIVPYRNITKVPAQEKPSMPDSGVGGIKLE